MDLLSEYHKTAVAQGEIDLKDAMNRDLSLTMLMEGDWRESYNKVKVKKAVA